MASFGPTEVLVMRFDVAKAMRTLNVVTVAERNRFRAAIKLTFTKIEQVIRDRVTRDIFRAGAFSPRWPAAFVIYSTVTGDRGRMLSGFSRAIPYGHVHEFGATIRGRPLLWIPLSFSDVPRIGPGSTRMWARDYPGGLFRVNRPGKNPLLLSKLDKKPKYVGVTHVTLRPRFHIRAITSNVVHKELAKTFAGFVTGVKLRGTP